MGDMLLDLITNPRTWYVASGLSILLFIFSVCSIIDLHWIWSLAPIGILLVILGGLIVLAGIIDRIVD
jgi:hypothetical protein